MAEASALNFSSPSPFNALIQQNMAQQQNPLTTAGQAVGLQTGMANAQRANTEANDAQLQNAQNHFASRISALTPYIAKGDKVTGNDVLGGLSDLVAASKGAFSANEAAHFYSQLPQAPNGDLTAPNPALAKALQQHQLQLMNAHDQISTMRGDPVAYNIGGKTVFGTRNSYTGAFEPQGGPNGQVTNTLSPEAAVAPQSGPPDPTTGAPTTITGGERAEQSGLAPAGQYTGRNGGPQQVYVGADGRITKRQQGLGTPMARAGGPMPTGLGPAQSSVIKASGDAYAAAPSYAQREQQLESGLTALQSTNTGPGTESRNAIESYMLALPGGLGRWIPGVDPKSVAAFDTANKYLTAAAAANPSAGRSDAGLSTAIASNPSVHISNQAAQDIQKANLGFIRFEKANMASFGGQDASQWQSHIAQRNASIDPHAYSADLISPPQRAAYMASLSSSGKAKYLASIRDAMNNGAFTPADLQQGGAGGR